MRINAAILAVALFACGPRSTRTAIANLRTACPTGVGWNGTECAPWGKGAETVASGETALSDGQLDVALSRFKQAVTQGPHAYSTLVHLYEQLGIASAYRNDEAAAMLAFGRLLLIAPGHLLSYRLSPTATLKFEEARRTSARSPAPNLAVSWPDDLDVGRPIKIQIEVVADPARMLNAATLYIRGPGDPDGATRAVDIELAPAGQRKSITLPPLGGDKPQKLSLNLVARDQSRNEVLLWASPEQPRSLRVGYQAPTPLHKKPWPYIAIGGVLAAVVGTGVYLVVRPDPEFIGGGSVFP